MKAILDSSKAQAMGASFILSPDIPLPTGRAVLVIGAFTGMGFLCIFQCLVMICATFQNRQTLYFRCIIASILGATLFNIGNVLLFFIYGYSKPISYICVGGLGYLIVVPAELLLLYSRLHVLSLSRQSLRWILCLIIAEYVLVTVPNAVTTFGALVAPNGSDFDQASGIFQRIEVCIYAATDLIISGLYAYQIISHWGSDPNSKARKVVKLLVLAYVTVVCLDFTNVGLLFAGEIAIQTCWLGFLYSFKLEVEVWILRKLSELARVRLDESLGASSHMNGSTTLASFGGQTSHVRSNPQMYYQKSYRDIMRDSLREDRRTSI